MYRTTKLVALSALLISGVAVGCSNDDDDNLPPGEGGSISVTGGTAGAAGATTTTGGTAGVSGKAGATQGAGGAAGHAGAATAGASGSGGSAGAGAGGATNGGAGGNAGESQAGGTAGVGPGGMAGQAGVGGNPAGGAGAGGGVGGAAGGASGGTGGSAGGSTGPILTGTPDDMAAILAKLSNGCTDDITKIYDDIAAPTPWMTSNRGQVAKCAFDRLVPQAELSKHFSDIGAADPGIQTDVFKFRIAYWVERDPTVTEAVNAAGAGGSAGAGGTGDVTHGVLTTATIYIPALRAAGNSAASPLLVFAHGSVGSADICAPSKEDPSGFQVDWQTAVYELIGHGWITVMPDYPGLGTTGAASWSYSKDEGRSILDATRAVRSVLMSSLVSGANTMIGHSQGGHAVLSAQSYAKDYTLSGTFDAAVTYAPLYFSMGSWGAEMSSLAVSLMDFTPDIFSYATQYIYGHLAAHLGESHSTDAFLPGQAAAAKNMLETMCLDQLADPTTGLWSLTSVPGGGGGSAGAANAAGELYPTEYTSNAGVAGCGALGACKDNVSMQWRAFWAEDRPAIDPTIPVVIWAGGQDTSVSPQREHCVVDRITETVKGVVGNPVPLTVCTDQMADHSSILRSGASWVEQYLMHEYLGGPAAASCPGLSNLDPAPPASPLACSTPPPNSVNPSDP